MTSRIPRQRLDEITDKLAAITAARDQITAQDVCDLAVRWLERDYRNLVESGVAQQHDEELARVVAAYLNGTASAEQVSIAAAGWRAHFTSGETSWLDGWDQILIEAIDDRRGG